MSRDKKPLHIPPPETFQQWPSEIQAAVKGWDWALDPDYTGQMPSLLVLPFPPSSNRYWRTYRGIHSRSQEADNYINIVRGLCQMAMIEPLTGDLQAIAHIYRNHAGRDLNNCTKVLYDALQGYLYLNDNQICDERHIRDYDLKNPRVVIFIAPVTAADAGKIKPSRKKG